MRRLSVRLYAGLCLRIFAATLNRRIRMQLHVVIALAFVILLIFGILRSAIIIVITILWTHSLFSVSRRQLATCNQHTTNTRSHIPLASRLERRRRLSSFQVCWSSSHRILSESGSFLASIDHEIQLFSLHLRSFRLVNIEIREIAR